MISFIKKLVQNIDIIQSNMQIVRNKVKGSKNPALSKEFPFGFRDEGGTEHSIWDLYEYYGKFKGDVSKIDPCPVMASFQKFIKEWEDELDNLTK